MVINVSEWFAPAWQVIALAAWLLLIHAAVSAPDDEIEALLRQAVIDALHAAHLTLKDAAFAMRLHHSQLEKQLRGEGLISLTRLVRLPWVFWFHFSPALIALVTKKHLRELAEDVSWRRGA